MSSLSACRPTTTSRGPRATRLWLGISGAQSGGHLIPSLELPALHVREGSGKVERPDGAVEGGIELLMLTVLLYALEIRDRLAVTPDLDRALFGLRNDPGGVRLELADLAR